MPNSSPLAVLDSALYWFHITSFPFVYFNLFIESAIFVFDISSSFILICFVGTISSYSLFCTFSFLYIFTKTSVHLLISFSFVTILYSFLSLMCFIVFLFFFLAMAFVTLYNVLMSKNAPLPLGQGGVQFVFVYQFFALLLCSFVCIRILDWSFFLHFCILLF